MALAQVPRPAFRLKEYLLCNGVDKAYVRRMTERGDNLRAPLTPNREASLRDDRDALLLRLFFCGEVLSSGFAQEALGAEMLAAAENSGLLLRGHDGLRSPFHLRYVRDLLLMSDYLTGEEDAVMGAGETTAILYQAARPTKRVGRTLDLGCGAGTLALLLAGCSDWVVGTDVNERAVRFGQLNAELNAIQNVEFRAGDTYEPVAEEQFDLIVSQPPYYPASHSPHQTFLHGGARGDELALRVVEGVQQHLIDGGRALIFTSWPEDRGPRPLPGFDVLELYSNRNEVSGTRQSLNVFQKAEPGRTEYAVQFAVSADCWGLADGQRIDELFANEALLKCGPEGLLKARLRLPPGSRVLNEGEQILLQCQARELIGCVPVARAEWRILKKVDSGEPISDAAELEVVRQALRRGLLRVTASA